MLLTAGACLVCLKPVYGSESSWFSGNRLQIHTAIGPTRRGGMKSIEINSLVKGLGLNAYTRHVRSDWRDPFWLGLVDPFTLQTTGIKTNRELLKTAVKKAGNDGIRVGAYYWEAGGRLEGSTPNEENNLVSHPSDNLQVRPGLRRELLCKDASGELIPERAGKKIRGWHADLSSPEYREIVLSDLIEIAELGFSTVFFDERHFPNANQSPCFGASTEGKYRKKYGPFGRVKNWSEEQIFHYITFQASEMASTFEYWKSELRKRGFSILFVVSGTYLSNLVFPHMSIDLARVADSVKMEYQHGLRKSIGGRIAERSGLPMADPDIRKYLAWILARDLGNGLPPYIWRQTFQDAEELEMAVTEILFHGGVAGIHVADRLFGAGGLTPRYSNKHPEVYIDTPLSVVESGISQVSLIANLHANSRVYAEVGVLIDEAELMGFKSSTERWSRLSHPLQIVVQELYEWGIPFRILTDQQLYEKIDPDLKYILPVTTSSEKVSHRLSELVSGGGVELLTLGAGPKLASSIRVAELGDLLGDSSNINTFQLRVGLSGRRSAIRSTFNKTIDGKILVGLICSSTINCVDLDGAETPKLTLLKKPERVLMASRTESLAISQVSENKWEVSIPKFDSRLLLVLEFKK